MKLQPPSELSCLVDGCGNELVATAESAPFSLSVPAGKAIEDLYGSEQF